MNPKCTTEALGAELEPEEGSSLTAEPFGVGVSVLAIVIDLVRDPRRRKCPLAEPNGSGEVGDGKDHVVEQV
jgi:hypothetical protein